MPDELDNTPENDDDTPLPELDDEPEGDPEGDPEGEGDDPEGEEGEEGSESDEGTGGRPRTAEGDGGQPSRRTRRVQTLERERDEANERFRRLEETVAQLRTTAAPNPNDEAARRAEADRVAAMTPEDKRLYDLENSNRNLQAQVGNLGFHMSDATDRASFEAKATINPTYKKYAGRVETALMGMRKNGANTTREALLTYMIGEDARKRLENKEGSEPRRRAARERVERTAGRSNSNVRSDTGGTSRSDPNSLAALEKRLSGVSI